DEQLILEQMRTKMSILQRQLMLEQGESKRWRERAAKLADTEKRLRLKLKQKRWKRKHADEDSKDRKSSTPKADQKSAEKTSEQPFDERMKAAWQETMAKSIESGEKFWNQMLEQMKSNYARLGEKLADKRRWSSEKWSQFGQSLLQSTV